ncbi:hypothetical protein D3C80_1457320 [compost metagenome]
MHPGQPGSGDVGQYRGIPQQLRGLAVRVGMGVHGDLRHRIRPSPVLLAQTLAVCLQLLRFDRPAGHTACIRQPVLR